MESFEYFGDYSSIEETVEGLVGMNLMSNLGSGIVSIVAYVFMAMGLYAIAKRRGIRNPWLAWIPIGNVWLLGCISDQYRYVARGQETSKRKVMLGLDIATFALAVVVMVLMFTSLISMFSHMDMDAESMTGTDTSYFAEVLSPMMIGVVLALVMCGTAIALMVLQYMAMHDLFTSCNPANATVFTVLSIVLSLFGFSVVQAIFIFVCRNKDLGMPPRRYQMYSDQPVWQTPQPPVEPWEHNIEE